MATGGESDFESGNDEYFDFLCSVCQRKNKIVEARKFCTDCQEYFCSICVNSHNDFPALRNHKILDKAKFKPGSSVQFPMVPTERCKVHGHKPVDMYCKQHDVVGCSTCMVIQHSVCTDKVYIPDYVKSNTKVENSTIAKQLDTITSSLGELQKTFLKEKKQLKSKKETSLQEIRKLRTEINQRLDDLEKKTLQDLDGLLQSLTDKINDTLKELQAVLNEVQSAQDNLKSAGSNMSQMFVSIKMANAAASKGNEKVTATQHQVSSPDISFVPTQKLQSLFNELQDLGSFSKTEKIQSKPRYPARMASAAKTQTNINDRWSILSLLQVKNSKTYKITEKSYEETTNCVIMSVCALDDGTIILVNFTKNKLLRLDSFSYKVRDSCEVSSRPYQICAISYHEVAVPCSEDQLIQFVSIGHTMHKTKQIKTGFYCVGLAYADEKLFVSDGQTSVYVYSMKGERLKQFSVPQSKIDSMINLWSLAVSSDGSTIYVAHRMEGLIILDRNGQLVGEFTDYKKKGARSVCMYNSNSVLVSGENSKNVLQISSKGQLIGEVLKTDMYCQAICYCKKSSKLTLVVDDGKIEVYDIN